MASTVLPNGIIIPEKYSRDWYNDLYHNWEELDNLLSASTPGDGTLTIQKNGTTISTFSANQETDETINIEVPTATSDLTNDSGFITEDNTKIPLDGTNAITGTGFFKSTSDSQLQIGSGTSTITGGCLVMYGSEFSSTEFAGAFRLRARTTTNYDLIGYANGTLTWGSKNVAMAENVVPRSGGAVMTGAALGRTINNSYLQLSGGTAWGNGAAIIAYGKDVTGTANTGAIVMGCTDGNNSRTMYIYPNGTWTWDGTACQITSDQRLKQQITEIDDKLLDAWQDVDLVQFKYNNAVDQKGKDKARLHTGYVVQQIDKACKEHDVDISAYGLYCHEEYPQETEEVEVEQEDGTKTKETKVIREASEHYSLRYTECLVVECKYLRRCIARLTARIEELEKGNKEVEK